MLRIENLGKRYGQQWAVSELSFLAQPGQILGFLGPNGAGKSTTMKMATGYISPTEGNIWIGQESVAEKPLLAKRKIGYLPEHNPLYLDMYVHEYLLFISQLHGLKSAGRKARVAEVVELCGIGPEQNKKLSMLSKGYRQRVGLAQTLIHQPEVLILDEPTTGLDPNQIVEIRRVIKSVAQDKVVVLSTHIMQEVQALCDQVVILRQGKRCSTVA